MADPDKKNAASIRVIEKENGRWYLHACDNVFEVHAERALPQEFKDFSDEKKNYWLQKLTQQCARELKQAIRRKKFK